jgi:hypothetical protein
LRTIGKPTRLLEQLSRERKQLQNKNWSNLAEKGSSCKTRTGATMQRKEAVAKQE